jgi:hypothetical protein
MVNFKFAKFHCCQQIQSFLITPYLAHVKFEICIPFKQQHFCPEINALINLPILVDYVVLGYKQGGLKLQAWTLAVLPHSLVGHSMTYGVTKILEPIDI